MITCRCGQSLSTSCPSDPTWSPLPRGRSGGFALCCKNFFFAGASFGVDARCGCPRLNVRVWFASRVRGSASPREWQRGGHAFAAPRELHSLQIW